MSVSNAFSLFSSANASVGGRNMQAVGPFFYFPYRTVQRIPFISLFTESAK